uniref:NADH-ubiquinone oxidoreductase chain 2 n=1 Tax=Poecilia catemaconis TaxID=80269 RepID=O79242_9TELE|nr:NADH dehydrogenase subunit 2 [Poecilia catemaconis]ADT62380.1 NADH dehydrogenase subunit 2 [Poecilia catemaconis]AGC13414.1 NADH dehydrogenase subunit 1 [Poecilia catemaconis]AGC13415.1 NADH dehydrogenase subunit 1 [Poecilia catemaconis]
MAPLIYSALIISLGLGTTMTFASTHWYLAWMGIEINTLAIIPLMAQNHIPRAIEATTKYFFIQATASATLLFASISNAFLTGQWDITHTPYTLTSTMITLALAMKIGLAPLHSWMPEVMQGLNLLTGLILSTWQKLAPLYLIFQIQPNSPNIFIALGILSILVGGWGGFNQVQLRKILAYSSISHMGWMILILSFSPPLALLTIMIYILMTFSLFSSFMLTRTTHINSLATTWAKIPILNISTPLVLLSLGGLPPLTGFMPKWLILQELTKQSLSSLATMAALSSLLSLYFYLRLSYAMTLTMPPNNPAGTLPWRLNPWHNTLPMALTITSTICLLPMTPAIMSLLPF